MHVSDDFAKVILPDGSDGGDLKKAIIAELQLVTAPHRVRLLREVEGGAPVPVESLKKLSETGVADGSRV